MTEELTLAARILLDSQNYVRGLTQVKAETREAAAVIGESFKRAGEGMLRAIGVDLVALKLGMETFEKFRESGARDKTMYQIGRQANWSKDQIKGARDELWKMARETGEDMEHLTDSLADLVGHGVHEQKEALETLTAINRAMLVTTASADSLASALAAAKANFNFPINNAKDATNILDAMYGATQHGGHLKMEALATVMGSGDAKYLRAAGFKWGDSLNLAEQLSIGDEDPGHVALAMKNISMLFGDAKRMQSAQRAAHVKFFDKHGAQNDPLEILAGIEQKMAAMKTDRRREAFLEKVFKGTGQRQLISLRQAMTTDKSGSNPVLDALRYSKQNSRGMIDSQEQDALDNMQDQGKRLNMAFGQLTDRIAQPIDRVLAKGIEKLINPKDKGGLGLSGANLMEGLAGVGAAGWIGKKLGGSLLGKLLADPTELVKGKVLQQVSGVTPVFVVNMPGGGTFPGIGGPGATVAEHTAAAVVEKTAAKVGIFAAMARWGGSLFARTPMIAAMTTPLMVSGDSGPTTAAQRAAAAKRDQPYEDAWAKSHGYKSANDMETRQLALINANAKALQLANAHADSMKHGIIDRSAPQKSELAITIDNNGNAKITKMSLGDAFSNIETSIRNSAAGRMMSSI